jgi:flagellin
MSVSVNTSFTAPIRGAVANNLDGAKKAMRALATGDAFSHAYEDPTGAAIGSRLKREKNILSVVETGIKQSMSMLYMAEAGLKSAEKVITEMETNLSRAKLGYMTDELVLTTLSPAYTQMKEELNRIADSINFNGQKLLNGTGGEVTYGKASTVNTGLTTYNMNNAVSGLRPYGANATIITNIAADVIDNDKPTPQTKAKTNLTVTAPSTNTTPVISGGKLTANGAGFVLSNATLTIKDVLVKDTAGTGNPPNPQNSATADLVIKGVTLEFATATINNGVLTATAAPVVKNIQPNNVSFENIKPPAENGIVEINNIQKSGTPDIAIAALGGTGTVTISNIDVNYESTGGVNTTSSFNFVTGTDLANDVIKVNLPNISLVDAPGAPSVISSLNVSGLQTKTMPNSLTNLTCIADADKDIPIVAALRDQIITFSNALGAFQLRFINLTDQLATAVEQADNAQGAILNADLGVNAEKLARNKVNLNMAIAMLNESNRILENLQTIVTG